MSDVKITKTEFEKTEPVGRELVRKANEDRDYRRNWAGREIDQASKEIAGHIAGLARGRVSVTIDAISWERIFGRKNAKKHSERNH